MVHSIYLPISMVYVYSLAYAYIVHFHSLSDNMFYFPVHSSTARYFIHKYLVVDFVPAPESESERAAVYIVVAKAFSSSEHN